MMARSGMAFPAGLMRALMMVLLLLVILLPHAFSRKQDTRDNNCPPSSCGNILHISNPFRLTSDPPNCGDQRYELSCDEKNQTVLTLFGGKYYVRQINYNNYTIRVVDSGIQEDNNSFIPLYSPDLYSLNYGYATYTTYEASWWNASTRLYESIDLSINVVVIVNCEKPVMNSSYLDLETTSTCSNNINNDGSFSSFNSSLSSQYSKRYLYALVGGASVMDFEDSCRIEQMSLSSWAELGNHVDQNISCTDLHNIFLYGFELSWYRFYCGNCDIWCDLDDVNRGHCEKFVLNEMIPLYLEATAIYIVSGLIGWHVAVIPILGTPFVIAFLIYKWRRRHLSMYNAIEEFLQSQNNLVPISYSFSEIKKMTKCFREKLGEGGYGTVFKGTLRSGYLVAVKMLGQSKTNGQDFINEVATIGRIHHVNVVQLIGYCVHGSKRALVYDFMPKGSLNKYIFSSEESIFLDNEKTYNIALGVARGIEYLHRGCDMQILHFDIKPHNILLDENFTPKVSDFGLAKLYPIEDNTICLTAARGTLGYMAPELFYKNIGGISYKSDVYSFGMLLMEMVGKRKNLNAFAEHSSQIYFPTWVYDQFNDGKDIEMECATEEEKAIVRKMIIVALWCIQMNPSNRPSMSKVIEMLEGEVKQLQIPSRAPLSSPERVIKDCEDNSSQDWLSSQTLPSTS